MSSSGRGRGGKFQKPKRGGGKHFSRNLRPLDAEGVEKSIWASESSNSESDDSDASSSEEEPANVPAGANFGNTPSSGADQTRDERRAAAKARKQAAIKRKTGPAAPGDLPPSDSDSEEDNDMPANPNHTAKARAQAAPVVRAASPAEADAAPKKVAGGDTGNLSRREREAFQAAQAKERYQKLQAAGKTEEARSDLERLKLVRQKREEEAARKEAERQEREEHEKAKSDQMAREERQRALAAGKKGRGKK